VQQGLPTSPEKAEPPEIIRYELNPRGGESLQRRRHLNVESSTRVFDAVQAWGGDIPICTDPFPGIVHHDDKVLKIEDQVAAWAGEALSKEEKKQKKKRERTSRRQTKPFLGIPLHEVGEASNPPNPELVLSLSLSPFFQVTLFFLLRRVEDIFQSDVVASIRVGKRQGDLSFLLPLSLPLPTFLLLNLFNASILYNQNMTIIKFILL